MLVQLLILRVLVVLVNCSGLIERSQAHLDDGYSIYSDPRPEPPEETDSNSEMCVDPGVMNFATCDRQFISQFPASTREILNLTTQFMRMNYSSTFDLAVCQCCNIKAPGQSNLRVCNRKKKATAIHWSVVGLLGRTVAKEPRCSKLDKVLGSYTWTSSLQIWTLFVLGDGSPMLNDTTPQCSTLVHTAPSTNGTSSSSASPRLSTAVTRVPRMGRLQGTKSRYAQGYIGT